MDYQYPLLLFTFLISLSVYLLTIRSSNNNDKNILNIHPDDYKPYPILGHLPYFVKNRHRFHDWVTELLASSPTNTITFHRPYNHGVFTANPTNIEHMLKTNFDNYPKGKSFTSALHDMFGRGFFSSDGHDWKVQRNTASHEFTSCSLRGFVYESVKMEISTRLLPLLKKYADSEKVIDIQAVFEHFAFDNVCKLAFNKDPACLTEEIVQHSSPFGDAFEEASELTLTRLLYAVPNFWRIKKLFNIGSERSLKESIGTVHDFVAKFIQSRIKELQTSSSNMQREADDLVSRCLLADKDYDKDYLRDFAISFILAGRETTSSALTWFFWQLSSRPEVQRKILEEIASIRSQRDNPINKRDFEFDELKKMHYLHAALSESLRLYPPVPQNLFECLKDEILPDGTEIKRGWFIAWDTYAMGRIDKIWGKDCLEYKPERWLDDSGMFRPESPFKFVQFQAGPRMCLGKEMAYIQMKAIVASVLERFVVEMVDKDKEPTHMISLTLRMRGGLSVFIRNRD